MVANATKIDDRTVLAVANEKQQLHGSIIAQIAQQILEIEGVSAAYVLAYNSQGKAAVSARSNGDVNVQVIMEKIGGGGHFNAAAAQRSEINLQELEEELIKAHKE